MLLIITKLINAMRPPKKTKQKRIKVEIIDIARMDKRGL